MTFLLVRHGSVDYDAYPGRFRGHGIDLLPLTAAGIGEAEALGIELAAANIDLIVSSPMTRSLQTAMIASWRVGSVLQRYAGAGTVAVLCHSGVIEAMTGASHSAPCEIVPFPLA